IDYVVTKVPRFTFEKFSGTEALLTTSMKSVGVAMSIGRSFAESVQKELRSMETGLTGLNEIALPGGSSPVTMRAALAQTTTDRTLVFAQASRHGMSVEEVKDLCKGDPWFLREIRRIVAAEAELAAGGLPDDAEGLLRLKKLGFY